MSIADVKKMSMRERLTAMEQLWDALCHDQPEPDSPEWHQPVLEARRQKMSSPEARFYTLDELRKRFA